MDEGQERFEFHYFDWTMNQLHNNPNPKIVWDNAKKLGTFEDATNYEFRQDINNR